MADYSFPMTPDVTFENLYHGEPERVELSPALSGGGFVDERPCVMPSIVNHHQQLSLTTDFHNFPNSFEPVRVLDYFSGPMVESQQNDVYNQFPSLPPYGPYPMAEYVPRPDYLQTPILYTDPPQYLQLSQSVPDSDLHDVPAPVTSVKDSIVRKRSASDELVNKDLIAYEGSPSNKRVKYSIAYEVPAFVNTVIESNVDGATTNKENSDPINFLTKSDIYQQYCKYFKKKLAVEEEKLNDLAKLEEASLMENNYNYDKDDSMKLFRHKKLNHLIPYSTVEETTPVSKSQDEAQRVPFKEQFSNAKPIIVYTFANL